MLTRSIYGAKVAALVPIVTCFCYRTFVLVLIFSLYLTDVYVPIPTYSRKKKLHMGRYPIFKLLPVRQSKCCFMFQQTV